jgi:anti-anti-sigma factor
MTPSGSPSVPDAECQVAMGRVWTLYDSAYEEIQVELRERLSTHPEFGPLLRSVPQDPQEDARTRAILSRAMLDADWEAYWTSIRAQAAGYANAEVTLASWIELVHDFRSGMIERIFAAHEPGAPELQGDITALDRWLDDVLAVFGQEFIATSQQVIARQERAIRQLSTPVLQLHPGLLILPIVGSLDRERIQQMRAELLDGIRRRRARAVVLDVTGVPEIDSVSANQLVGAVRSAGMMGAQVIISGLSAEISLTLVIAGIDLEQISTAGDLQGGIEQAEAVLSRVR